MVARDYYQILGISRDAHLFEVRKAFREKAKVLHPDKNPDAAAHEEFKKVNEAYQVLCDHNQRKIYDLRLQNGFPAQKVYYRPGKVKYRAKGERYAHYSSAEEANPKMEKLEKYFDFFLFITLLAAGCFALGYGIYRLWVNPQEEVNPWPGIVMGVFFTGLMLALWRLLRKAPQDT